MNRRGFLSLLVASPLVPALAKLPGLAPAGEHPLALVAPGDAGELAELVGNVEEPRTLEALRAAAHAAPLVRRAVLPFGPENGESPIIGAGRIGTLVGMPQAPFRADRLVTVEGFDLLGLTVNGEPVLEQAVRSDLFLPGSPYCGAIGFHMTQPGDVIVMVVRNCGPSRRFSSSLVGNVVGL